MSAYPYFLRYPYAEQNQTMLAFILADIEESPIHGIRFCFFDRRELLITQMMGVTFPLK
jgi:hypothetical protein